MQEGRVIPKDVESKASNFRKERARESVVSEMISRPWGNSSDTRTVSEEKIATLERTLGKGILGREPVSIKETY